MEKLPLGSVFRLCILSVLALNGLVAAEDPTSSGVDQYVDFEVPAAKANGNYSSLNPVSVAVQADGKIVALCSTVVQGATPFAGNHSNLVTLRYHPDGTLDHNFGKDGLVVLGFSENHTLGPKDLDLIPGGVTVLKSGKILVVGTCSSALFFAQYNSNGTLDTSYGRSGIVRTSDNFADLGCVDFQPDGKTLVAGYSSIQQGYYGTRIDGGVVARYDERGALDRHFNRNGRVDLAELQPRYVERLSNGKILLAGTNAADLVVLRFSDSGAIDPTFEKAPLKIPSDSVFPPLLGKNCAASLRDGSFLLIYTLHFNDGRPNTSALLRLLPGGRIDKSYYDAGHRQLTGPLAFSESGYYLAAQPDGKVLVAAGFVSIGSSFSLMRLNQDGGIDTNFGVDGLVVSTIPGNVSSLTQLADGHLLLAGGGGSSPIRTLKPRLSTRPSSSASTPNQEPMGTNTEKRAIRNDTGGSSNQTIPSAETSVFTLGGGQFSAPSGWKKARTVQNEIVVESPEHSRSIRAKIEGQFAEDVSLDVFDVISKEIAEDLVLGRSFRRSFGGALGVREYERIFYSGPQLTRSATDFHFDAVYIRLKGRKLLTVLVSATAPVNLEQSEALFQQLLMPFMKTHFGFSEEPGSTIRQLSPPPYMSDRQADDPTIDKTLIVDLSLLYNSIYDPAREEQILGVRTNTLEKKSKEAEYSGGEKIRALEAEYKETKAHYAAASKMEKARIAEQMDALDTLIDEEKRKVPEITKKLQADFENESQNVFDERLAAIIAKVRAYAAANGFDTGYDPGVEKGKRGFGESAFVTKGTIRHMQILEYIKSASAP